MAVSPSTTRSVSVQPKEGQAHASPPLMFPLTLFKPPRGKRDSLRSSLCPQADRCLLLCVLESILRSHVNAVSLRKQRETKLQQSSRAAPRDVLRAEHEHLTPPTEPCNQWQPQSKHFL
ncbi:hypothetical protein CesoFtcFv8_010379 [Champsocephalus esox]|uniref:Uncharacterized protein n=1 Tax=Champsocephalus esox TaxID=159716 RepID=A0AAN8GZP0_9TELE|nr:hypothetical protein CesoFtcFv8_010379 [Champsocephalus esox]